MKTNLQELKVHVYFYTDGRNHPYVAYAVNTFYNWKVGDSEIEALARLRATYVSWQDLPFSITRIEK